MHVQASPVLSPRQFLLHEAFQDELQPSHWRVESTNTTFGDIYVAIFAGPMARERAIEYAKFKNRQP